jgi:hypothetical protein
MIPVIINIDLWQAIIMGKRMKLQKKAHLLSFVGRIHKLRKPMLVLVGILLLFLMKFTRRTKISEH